VIAGIAENKDGWIGRMNNHPTPIPSGEAKFIIGPAEGRTRWLRSMWSTLPLQGCWLQGCWLQGCWLQGCCWPLALDGLEAARRIHDFLANHLTPEVETYQNYSQGLRGLAQA
jgi:hypothetical protein